MIYISTYYPYYRNDIIVVGLVWTIKVLLRGCTAVLVELEETKELGNMDGRNFFQRIVHSGFVLLIMMSVGFTYQTFSFRDLRRIKEK